MHKNINAGKGWNFVGQQIPELWGSNLEWFVNQCNFHPYWCGHEQNSSNWTHAICTLGLQEDKVLDVKRRNALKVNKSLLLDSNM